MTELTRPDGTVIHYEVTGSGYPILALAPGDATSGIGQWLGGPIHPVPQTTVSGTEQGKGRKPAFFRPKTPNAGEALGFLAHLNSTADYEDMVAVRRSDHRDAWREAGLGKN